MNETEPIYHIPVLLQESIQGMNLRPGGIYADMTFGGGGHSKEILRQMDAESRLFSFDQDEDAERNIVMIPGSLLSGATSAICITSCATMELTK